MAAIQFRRFAGELPILDPYKLGEGNAQRAKNVRLWAGLLEPMRGLAHVQDASTASTPETIFQYRPDGTWFEWGKKVSAVHSPIPDDQYERVMYTGDGAPKVTSASQALSSKPYPTSNYRLGVPAPESAPTTTVNGTSDKTKDTRYYVVTYVNSWGEEGAPSPTSKQVEVAPDQTVDVDLPSEPAGNWDLDVVRIYRTNTSSNNAAFQYVGGVTIGNSTFTDDVPSAQLGEKLPSTDWPMPPDDLQGLVSLPGGFLAGFRNNQVLFSVPGLPHAWPVKYRQSVDYPIVGLGVLGNGLVVCTEGQPYVASGTSPAAMTVSKLDVPYSCESAEGIAEVGGSVLFPTARGLAMVRGGQAVLVTEKVIDTDDFAQLDPTSFRAFEWRDLYVCFYNDVNNEDGAFIMDPRSPLDGLVTMTGFVVEAGYNAPEDAKLYLAENNAIREWDAGDDLPFQWRSRRRPTASPMSLAVVQVHADGYPVTVTVYRDGIHQSTVTVGSEAPRRLPNARRGRNFDVEVSAMSGVREVALATSMQALKEV